jgi:hypothetical protein
MRSVPLRAILLLGFVIAMPILALPAVATRLDDWIYGPPPVTSAVTPLRSELQQALQPQMAERASPASFDEIDPAADRRQPHEGIDAALATPPLLSPHPAFPPLVTASPPPSGQAPTTGSGPAHSEPEIGPLSSADVARLQQIRAELERLGAEYIVLETTSGTGNYRFHCDIRVDEQTRYTRPFEFVATDPLAAAEHVLADVSSWRTAARPSTTRQR